MTNKELHNLIETIPHEVLTCGNIECTFEEVSYTRNRIDINFFLKDSHIFICYIRVFGNHTIESAYFEDDKEKPEFKDGFIAMQQTKAYLEILGFKDVN